MFKEFRADGLAAGDPIDVERPPDSAQICLTYVTYNKLSSVYYWLASIAVLLVNLLFYLIVDPLVRQIGFQQKRTESLMSFITISILLYVDLVVMPIMLDMNLIEFDEYHISKAIFQGRHTDMGAGWYEDTGGELIRTTLLFALQTLLDFAGDWAAWHICRCCARAEHRNAPRPKQAGLNIQNDYLRFREIHAGPEYAFYYQVSKTTVTVLICLSLGGLLPLLYPIGLLACAVQYTTERLSLAYFYRLPPRYGTQLGMIAATMITYAAPLSFALMLWQYTNK
jgi:hypothetical protein